MEPFVFYSSDSFRTSQTAVIFLPDKFGMTQHAREMTNQFARIFKVHAFALEYFYELNGTMNVFGSDQVGIAKSTELVEGYEGVEFQTIFERMLYEVKKVCPPDTKLIVAGCGFGGALALYSSIYDEVDHIIAWYPDQIMKQEFDKGRRIIDRVVSARRAPLEVDIMIATQDESLNDTSRQEIKTLLTSNESIAFRAHEFDAKTGFMNINSNAFSEESCDQAWQKLNIE